MFLYGKMRKSWSTSDNLCDIFKDMLENEISPLFLKKQHRSNCKRNIKNNFPSNPWYDKECKSLKQVLNNIAKHKKFKTIYINII